MGNSNDPVMFRLPLPVRRLLGAAACGVALWPATARAARTCTVRLTPAGEPGWQAAADHLQAVLSTPGAHGDCGTVDIDVQDNGATLVFTTRDGRRAVRRLAAPSELEPTVEMLSVTGPAPPPEKRVVIERDRYVAVPHAPVAPEKRPRIVYGASAGVRVGAETLLSPVLRAFGSIALGPWELGILSQWDVRYNQLVDAAPGVQSAWALAGGVTAARRQPLSDTVSLRAGADLMMAALDEESSEHSVNEGRAEARVGAFVGAVLPRRAASRWRATLGADFCPTHIGKSPTNLDGVPLLPWWAFTLTVGVELGGS